MSSFIKGYCEINKEGIRFNGETIWAYTNMKDVDEYLLAAYNGLNIDYPKYYRMDRLSKLSLLGIHVLHTKGVLPDELSDRTGLIFSNQSSSFTTDDKYIQASFKTGKKEYERNPGLFVYTLPNISIGEICIRYKITGEHVFLITTSFNAAMLANYAFLLFEGGYADNCIIAWIDDTKDSIDVFICFFDKTVMFHKNSIFDTIPSDGSISPGVYLTSLMNCITTIKTKLHAATIN